MYCTLLCLQMAMECDDGDALHELVLECVPEALVISNVGKERNYRLPFASAGKFVGMFREMDGRVSPFLVAEEIIKT